MQYLLTQSHFINSQLLPAGTLVGDNTSYPFKNSAGAYLPPSLAVIAKDAAAKTAIAAKFTTTPDGNAPLKKR